MAGQISHILAAEEALLASCPDRAAAYGIAAPRPDSPQAPSVASGQKAGAGSSSREGPSVGILGSWFRLGSQGPDVFYHNQRTKPLGIHYGTLAHKRAYGALSAAMAGRLIAMRAETGRNMAIGLGPAEAWLFGFVTHAALDRASHPFIVYFAGYRDFEASRASAEASASPGMLRSAHPFFERVLDLLLLRELRGIQGRDYRLAALLPSAEEISESGEGVRELLATGLRTTFPTAGAKDQQLEARMRNSLVDAQAFYAATDPSRTAGVGREYFAHFPEDEALRRLSLVYPETIPEDIDYLNRKGQIWEHPAGDGRASRQSFLDLYKEGVLEAGRALHILEAVLKGEAGPPDLAAAIGGAGLSVTDSDGEPVRPRASKPLPLAALLRSELLRRLRD